MKENKIFIHPYLYVGKTPHKGRGVFTERSLDAGVLIEVAPVIELSWDDTRHIEKTKLYHYYFIWGSQETRSAIALGWGSLYNHSYQPNVIYEAHYEDQILVFKTLKKIDAHQELFINYNCDPSDRKALWFDPSE